MYYEHHEHRIVVMASLNVQSRFQDWDTAKFKDVYFLLIKGQLIKNICIVIMKMHSNNRPSKMCQKFKKLRNRQIQGHILKFNSFLPGTDRKSRTKHLYIFE